MIIRLIIQTIRRDPSGSVWTDDVQFSPPVVRGDRACVEYWVRYLDEHGTAMTLAGCAMARFDADGLITDARDYWHLQEGHEVPEWDG